MKKLTLPLLAALLCLSCTTSNDFALIEEPQTEAVKNSDSHYVPLESARQELAELLADIDAQLSRATMFERTMILNGYTTTLHGGVSRSGDDTTLIHVFNFVNDNGYAIMSTDDRKPSLLVLVESGHYDPVSIEENPGTRMYSHGLELWLKDSGDPFIPGGGGGGGTSDRTSVEWKVEIPHPERHCKVKWYQDSPYNLLCPKKDDGMDTKAGCVPIAVAQLMTIHKFPPSHRNHFFHWDEITAMPLYGDVNPQYRDDIPRLIQLLGIEDNLNVDYGVFKSSANMGNIARTMTAFGYRFHGTYNNYNADDVVYELSKGRPVILDGTHKDSDGFKEGHAWLAHGLMIRTQEYITRDNNGEIIGKAIGSKYRYILCNWGWKSGDGYYLENGFDPGVGPEYFENGNENTSKGTKKNPFTDMHSVIGIEP